MQTTAIHELVTKDIAKLLVVDISRIACGRYLCWLLLFVIGLEEFVQEVDLRQ